MTTTIKKIPILACLLLLTACGTSESAVTEATVSVWESVPGTESSTEQEDSTDAADTTAEEATTITDTEEADAASTEDLWDPIPGEDTWGPFPEGQEQTLSYCYQQLDTDDQLLYEELRRMIRTREETNLSTEDKEHVNEIYNMVLADHPEIFYVSGYTITSHTRGGALEYLSARANYIYDEEQTAEYERLIDTAVDSILLQAPTSGSDYEKVKFCYEYIIRNTDYDLSAEDNQNVTSVFLHHASVCSGYAKALQYLLTELGIPATTVTGTSEGVSHAWDLVQLDGEYYYVDPTWGDAQFTGSAASDKVWITYDYLNITTADLLTNHVPDDVVPLPSCTATANNYYVKEGLWFDSFSQQQLHTIVNDAYDSGDLTIQLRCANSAVYQEMYTALIENKEIYNYLYGSTSVTYSTSDTLYTMSILFN